VAKYTVLIPTRNEVDTLGQLVDGIWELPWDLDIVVADYESTDGTKELAEYKGVRVVRCTFPGKAAGVREALSQINSDYAIVVNADLTYPVEYIGLLILGLEKGYDGVVGVRVLKGRGSMSLVHSLGNFILSILASVLFGYWFIDINSGLWGYKKSVIDSFDLRGEGFCLEADIFTNAIMRGYKVLRAPIEYRSRTNQRSGITILDGFRIAFFLIRRRFGMV
jgi:dolichol-phosphate mannosyltransferase